MHRIVRALVALAPSVLLLAAAPAGAAEFAREGALVVGGNAFLDSAEVTMGDRTLELFQLELSPEATYFFRDRLGVRVFPTIRYVKTTAEVSAAGPEVLTGDIVDTAASGTVGVRSSAQDEDEETTLGLAAGPVYYYPLADRLHLGVGAHLGFDYVVLAEDFTASGFRYGGEVGLAYEVGTGGVVELGGRWTWRALTASAEGYDDVDFDTDDFLLGLRFGVAL